VSISGIATCFQYTVFPEARVTFHKSISVSEALYISLQPSGKWEAIGSGIDPINQQEKHSQKLNVQLAKRQQQIRQNNQGETSNNPN